MKKMISFFGGDSQVGTSMIAQSVAERLAEQGFRILLVFGSGKYGDPFIKNGLPQSIDDLKAGLRSGKVEREEVMQALEQRKNLWILPGVRNPLLAKYFPENTFQILTEGIREDFDYFIVDGGSDFQLGITISALTDCEERFFVTTQQAKALYRFGLYKKQIFEPLKADGKLIINKYVKDPALFLKHDVIKFCHMQEAFVLPYIEYGWQAEMEEKTLLSYKRFRKGIDQIINEFEPSVRKERIWKKSSV